MKISHLIALVVTAFALASVGCSASGRVSVKSGSASQLQTDPQLAYVTKLAPAPR